MSMEDARAAAAAIRNSARAAGKQKPREATHEPVHQPVRTSGATVEVNGEVLSRTRPRGNMGDEYDFDKSIVPDGFVYQWNAVSLYGNEQVYNNQNMTMYANGWRPVPAERHPGRWTPLGAKGAIIVHGARLEERPKILSDEAKEEEIRAAYQLIHDRNQSIQRVNRELPSGFAPVSNQNNVRITMDASLSGQVPSQSYQPPED